MLKSDQENAILDVLNDVCKLRGKENDSAVTIVESSPKGESQSSGIAERAVQDLDEGVRPHNLDFEAELKTRLRIGHPSIAWMVENVADIINKFKNWSRRDTRDAKEVETPGMTDEYDVQSFHCADSMSKESAAKCRKQQPN